MSNGLFSANLGNLQQVLNLRLQQHGLGASNLANANTPGYKAQRIDFERALSSVFDSDAEAMRRTDARHIGGGGSASEAPIVTIDAPAWAEDGNSVSAEEEMVMLANNNLQFNATVEVLSRQLALLEYAASDGGR